MRKIFILTMLLALMIVPGISFSAGTSTVQDAPTWNNPTTRVDGTALNPVTDEMGIRVFFGTVNPPVSSVTVTFTASYPAVVSNQTYTVTGLQPNTTYYYYVEAFDFYGNTSGASNIATRTSPNVAAPSAPSGCH
jgi:hypothetical protein